MTLRNVPKGYTLEQQRQEVNLIAVDLDTAVDGAQTFGGNKEFTGNVTFSANTYWGDLDKAIFGDDEDLKIYYDPSTGGAHIEAPIDLKLQTGRLIVNDAANSALQLVANQNGSVELYYNALKKFETSNTGATVTGTIVADEFSGPLTGDVTGNADTATALETARNIAGQSFDGTADITIAATDLSDTDQSLATTSDVTFNTITKAGGTSTEFLKADGTVDSNTYLTEETDPAFSASEAASITSTDTTNWDTAYGWGDHAAEGYLTSFTETDPIFSGSEAASITSTDTSNWDTAYGWGDHASEGYLTVAAGGTAPTSATDTGTPGEIRYDADFIYICIATDTWKRAPIATWT